MYSHDANPVPLSSQCPRSFSLYSFTLAMAFLFSPSCAEITEPGASRSSAASPRRASRIVSSSLASSSPAFAAVVDASIASRASSSPPPSAPSIASEFSIAATSRRRRFRFNRLESFLVSARSPPRSSERFADALDRRERARTERSPPRLAARDRAVASRVDVCARERTRIRRRATGRRVDAKIKRNQKMSRTNARANGIKKVKACDNDGI